MSARSCDAPTRSQSVGQYVQSLLETIRVRPLGFRQRFAGERGLEIVVRLGTVEILHFASPSVHLALIRPGCRDSGQPAACRGANHPNILRVALSTRPIDCTNSADSLSQSTPRDVL